MMEVAHGPLLRTYTAPTHARSLSQTRSTSLMPQKGHVSMKPPHSQGSGAPGPSPLGAGAPDTGARNASPPEPGLVTASDSIINQVADSSKSLYQICVKLRQRLGEVPGFQRHLEDMEHDNADDPVTSVWRCLKKGDPLLTMYNALEPESPIEIDPSKVTGSKRPKEATIRFLNACITHLNFPKSDCFTIMDLHGDNTTGFVKVTSAVNRVLDILQERNLLLSPEEDLSPTAPARDGKRTRRDYIIAELVDTERKYVQHLETLQEFKVGVEQKGEIPGDTIHSIFLNLNNLLDFQRRFLIRIETMNSLPEEQQNWGQLFIQSEEPFKVYEPYIANQLHADENAMREFEKLQKVGHRITSDRATLSGFLMKPFQRLSKYPLLLKELRDKCDAEDHIKEDISAGINAATSILERANSAIDKEQRQLAVEELQGQVDDWKGHDLHQFGELLMYGTYAVVKADGRNDVEKEYKIFLFERILLCCKDQNPNKQRNGFINMNRPTQTRPGKVKLALKGRIFMQNVTETLSLQKPGSYTVQIFWKGDPGVENFVIRFANEEVMKKWYAQVETQRKLFSGPRRGTNGSSGPAMTSDTEFEWVKNQGVPVHNPYRQDEYADEDDEGHHHGGTHTSRSDFAISRNASNASLRSRPPTGDGGPTLPPMGTRIPPPRFPMGQMPAPPLTLHTQMSTVAASPAERAAASYFSPTNESPASLRASSSSSMYPFPRQATPQNNWPGDEQNRFTAPAMGRTVSRDGQSGMNGYPGSSRAATRPSLPVMHNQTSAQAAMAQSRLRSASSPDIHNPGHPGHPGRRQANGDHSQPPVPDVPPFPTHMTFKTINRSNNNSPSDSSVRSTAQTAGAPRDRAVQPNHVGHPSGTDLKSASSTSSLPPSLLAGTDSRHTSSSMTSSTMSDKLPAPTQLKVKVSFESNYVTLVVGINISYQSLVDRIDAKLSRFTTLAIGRGNIRLRYRDEDGDHVTIRSDEDINIAFSDWREQQRSQLLQGQLGEIQLFCQNIDG